MTALFTFTGFMPYMVLDFLWVRQTHLMFVLGYDVTTALVSVRDMTDGQYVSSKNNHISGVSYDWQCGRSVGKWLHWFPSYGQSMWMNQTQRKKSVAENERVTAAVCLYSWTQAEEAQASLSVSITYSPSPSSSLALSLSHTGWIWGRERNNISSLLQNL